jgi:hypothetical protein
MKQLPQSRVIAVIGKVGINADERRSGNWKCFAKSKSQKPKAKSQKPKAKSLISRRELHAQKAHC